MSEAIVVTYTMIYDRKKANAYNDSLFSGPEWDDPVQGDGEKLVADVLDGVFSHGDCGEMPVEEAFVSAQLVVGGRKPIKIPSKARR
jgi:hypothetical protein